MEYSTEVQLNQTIVSDNKGIIGRLLPAQFYKGKYNIQIGEHGGFLNVFLPHSAALERLVAYHEKRVADREEKAARKRKVKIR